MSIETAPRVATRHECSLRNVVGTRHTSGEGTPKRKACAYCGGRFTILSGWYGVFVHSSVSGDNRYRAESAQSLHSSERSASKVIDSDTTGSLVVRWLSA